MAPNSPTKVLIVEDEPKLASLLDDYLTQAGFTCVCVDDGDKVLECLKEWQPDAMILDLMLPNRDGLSLCKEIRNFSTLPILMTTAKVEEIDRVLGLELGADDYICKPYSLREVVARLKAVLRRIHEPEMLKPSSFILNDAQQKMQYGGVALSLTTLEYQLLKKLASNAGVIFSRNQLMDGMYTDHRVVSDRTIDSHIKKLRKKLAEAFPGAEFIQSVYGAGYRFEVQQ
jgi:two-component system, OmpR family, response regulator BaeR